MPNNQGINAEQILRLQARILERERLDQERRNSAPSNMPPSLPIAGIAHLSVVEQNINTWKTSHTWETKKMKKKKSLYTFEKISEGVKFTKSRRLKAIEAYKNMQKIRMESARMINATRALNGTSRLIEEAKGVVRFWRGTFNDYMPRVGYGGYNVRRVVLGRNIDRYLLATENRVGEWRSIMEEFRTMVHNVREENRHNFDRRYDPLMLNTRPTNFYLQKGAIKLLHAEKYPMVESRSVGIEIECILPEKTDYTALYPVAKYINLGSDGSIRLEKSGTRAVEIRVVVPVAEMRPVVSTLCAILGKLGATVNKSCGLHVHLDQRFNDAEKIGTIFANFVRAQNLLFQVLPKSRRNNHYCKKQRGTDFNEAQGGNRYKAINAVSYRRHKTIEIRAFSGTVNGEKIINWIETLWAIEAGARVLRCPKSFDIAKRYWNLSAENLAWLKARQEKFAEIPVSENETVEEINEEEYSNV